MNAEQRTAHNLAVKFDALVTAEYPEIVPVNVVATAFISLFRTYCEMLPPSDRTLTLAETITFLVGMLTDNLN